jgi:hypothetical protein
MTAAVRRKIVDHLSNGAMLREAAAMVSVPWKTFEAEWLEAEKLHNMGDKSALARWYSDAAAARAKFRATLRLQAQQEAGDRSSADALKLLQHLESEKDPEMVDTPLHATVPAIETWSQESKDLADDLLRSLAGGPMNPPRGHVQVAGV